MRSPFHRRVVVALGVVTVVAVAAAVAVVELVPGSGRAASIVPASDLTSTAVQAGKASQAVSAISARVGFAVKALVPPPGYQLEQVTNLHVGTAPVVFLRYVPEGAVAPVASEINVQEWDIRLVAPAHGNPASAPDIRVDAGVPWAEVWLAPGSSARGAAYTVFAGKRTYVIDLRNYPLFDATALRSFIAPFQPAS